MIQYVTSCIELTVSGSNFIVSVAENDYCTCLTVKIAEKWSLLSNKLYERVIIE